MKHSSVEPPTTLQRMLRALKVLFTRRLVIAFDKVEFTYENLSTRRLMNWFLTEISFLFRSKRPWALPSLVQIEPANICNLRCPLCHVVTDHKPRGLLRFEDFKRVMDEIGDSILFLHFWGWGEPFLNDDIYKMMRYAHDKGLRIITSTNGHCFEKEENIDRLIDSGLDVLIFAMDGVDQQTYEQYRHQGDYQRVLNGLKRLLQRRNERGATLPRINLRMLVTRENESQVPAMHALANELGVDILSFKTLCSFDKPDLWNTMLPANPIFRRFQYDDQGNPIRIPNRCKKPWNHPVIYRDGLVVPCDYYTGEEFSLGYAFRVEDKPGQPSYFKKVWFGEEYRRFRAQFSAGSHLRMRCINCSLNYAPAEACVSHAITIQRA